MLVNVNADLFRIAALCQNNEDTRYYLCGVLIEPHTVGVILTATNGQYLLSIHDKTGQCDAPHIVRLSKDVLRACKRGKKDAIEHRLVIGDDSKAFVRSADLDIAVEPMPIVDGVFPDWRGVTLNSRKPLSGDEHVPAFAHDVIRVLCDVARELNDKDIKAGFYMTGATTGLAATVRFTGAPHAFALAMPIRNDDKIAFGANAPLPAWYQSCGT